MSQRDLDDPRFQGIVSELREKAPSASEGLRERVGATARSERARTVKGGRWNLGLRRGLALAAACTVAVGVGAAVVNGLVDSGEPGQPEALRAREPARDTAGAQETPETRAELQARADRAALQKRGAYAGVLGDTSPKAATALPPAGRRLQDYDAEMRLRVEDAAALDSATKRAMRDARSLGGFVVSTNFSTRPEDEGDATLVLKVPIDKVQEAIARFSALGTIVTQRVAVDDLQTEADRLSRTIAQHRHRIAQLRAKEERTPAEEVELQSRIAALQELTRRRTGIVREASYASVTLELTTQEAAEKREEPGAFRTFWDDASKILGTELIWLLYALVVAGPFLLLAFLALLLERNRRRRSADSLLAHN